MISHTIDRISVLITAYKNADLVRRCLGSLVAALGGRLPETVLVDDTPGDEGIRKVTDEFAGQGLKFVVMPKNGGWCVYDVIVEGVSLVKNYRTQFQDILQTSSPDELTARVKTKALEARNASNAK